MTKATARKRLKIILSKSRDFGGMSKMKVFLSSINEAKYAERRWLKLCELRQSVLDKAKLWAALDWEDAASDESFKVTGELQEAVEKLKRFEKGKR